MDADALASTYLAALETLDVDLVVGLFSPDGTVHSPLYGPQPAAEFYPKLFADTSGAHLSLRAVMQGTSLSGAATISFWFHFDWRLPSGAAAPFDVVDVAELNQDGQITDLHIIYDTVDVRPSFEAEVWARFVAQGHTHTCS